jgi:glycosyltransferase involved in cell wall biosynthesis
MRKKVFFLQEIIPNYRTPVLQRLSGLDDIALTVFYSRPSRRQQRANLRNAQDMSGFASIRLPLLEIGNHSYQLSFIKHLLAKRPDIVITGKTGQLDALIFLFMCRLLGIRLLWFAGGVPYIDERKIREITERGRMNRLLGVRNPRRWMINRADGMIVYSEHARDYYRSLGFPAEKIWVAPNSPDTDALLQYELENIRDNTVLEGLKKKYLPNGETALLMLGRLNKGRKTDVLLRAFKLVLEQHPWVRLLIIGDGSERGTLDKLVSDERIPNVHFIGAIYNERDLAPYFMLCDVFVTPGVASLALKIAMTFGRPVITVDHGLEVHDIEDGENGFIVPMNDISALADKILLLIRDEELRNRMRNHARQTILHKVNIEKMINGFSSAIRANSH